MVDDTELTAALAANLDVGFADVVRVHERTVYSVALRLAAPADAEDLAADAFLRAYRAFRGYDGAQIRELRLRPWLLTIPVAPGRRGAGVTTPAGTVFCPLPTLCLRTPRSCHDTRPPTDHCRPGVGGRARRPARQR